jgi:hypothetical protein
VPPDELIFLAATTRLGCCADGGLRACRTTVRAKLMSDWRTRGASRFFHRKIKTWKRIFKKWKKKNVYLYVRIQLANTMEGVNWAGSIQFVLLLGRQNCHHSFSTCQSKGMQCWHRQCWCHNLHWQSPK